ncbi:MAG: hypothetical protein K2Q20_06455, partial [Phycisphaerales bacterium]|nr:hypothetical protein [Phycisphaerales bacterium]
MISRVCAKTRAGFLSSLAAAAGSALCLSTALGATPLVPGQAPFNQPVCCTPRAALPGEGGDAGAGADRARAADLIQRTAFAMLPPEQQAKLVAAGAVSVDVASLPPEIASMPPLGDEGYAVVRRIVRREVFDRMLPVHQRALVKQMEDQAAGETPRMLCFSPTTDQDVVDAFNRAASSPFNSRFQQGNRWSTTATNTTPTGQGDRVTLRYSFVPDGTSVPNLSADAATSGATSNLFAFLNTIYGSPAVWQPIYQQVFTRWSGLIGVNYVLESNDDGVPIASGNAGSVGVRGDLRLAGTTLDGASNVLAFNYFPGAGVGGDMVIDTADNFFNT